MGSVAAVGHPSAHRGPAPAVRPVQERGADTTLPEAQPPTTDLGVRIIHQVPGGMACVEDQVERKVQSGQDFKALLYTQYKDADVAETMAQANDLIPNSDGAVSVYVPAGDVVIIPAMCYSKSGADAVSLGATGQPTEPSPIGGLIVFILLLLLFAFVAGLFRRLWRFGRWS
jgi:hypothetical protein